MKILPYDKNKQSTNEYDPCTQGIVTYTHHNRRTIDEFSLEARMQEKRRINTLIAQRNGLPVANLGDKNYKAVEYQKGFFNEGGLITGST